MIAMTKRVKSLYSTFRPEKYMLYLKPDQKLMKVTITGQKVGRPSKRVTFHQKGLKIKGAKVIFHSKKGNLANKVTRINHIKSFEELRIHTVELLYPGLYQIEMHFSSKNKPDISEKPQISRDLLPCIDEPQARLKADLQIK